MNDIEFILAPIFFLLFITSLIVYIAWQMSRGNKKEYKEDNTHTKSHQRPPHASEHPPTSTTSTEETPAPQTKDAAHPAVTVSSAAIFAEDAVEDALRGLNEPRYFVFRDLIIPSPSRDLSLTQIDHVVVSRTGIFCIETKSHRGSIYGYSRSGTWKQYLKGKNYSFNSPFRQNQHHVRALEMLLKDSVLAPVHSYIALPNASQVVVDNKVEDMSIEGVISKINKHSHVVYEPAAIEKIAKILAHAATFRNELRGRHAEEIAAYLEAKVAKTIKNDQHSK